MPVINYQQVASRFYTKAEAYDFVYGEMDTETVEKFLCSYIHSSVAYPMIRKLFTTVTMDDDAETITFNMQYSIDDTSDAEFVTQILADEMVIQWIKPKVTSLNTIVQHFSTSQSKFYSQSQHLQQLVALYTTLNDQVRQLISDRGGQNNTYLNGASSSSSLPI